jgi:hypothetical protein
MSAPDSSSVTGFAAALASHLPGRWQAGPPAALTAPEAGTPRIWHSGPLSPTALDTDAVQRCVLTSPHGLQLYVMPRPRRPKQFLVLPMLPAGCEAQHVRHLTAPPGIAVPADPVPAAATVHRRLLTLYRFDAMAAQRAASPRLMQVQVTVGSGRPRVRTTSTRALYLLLGRDGFQLDPATGDCLLPDTLPPLRAARQLRVSLTVLRGLGYHIARLAPLPRPCPPPAGPVMPGPRRT